MYCTAHIAVLLLLVPEVFSSFGALQLELGRLVADKLLQMREFQHFPHFFITVFLKGIEVHPQSPREQDGLLQTHISRTTHRTIRYCVMQNIYNQNSLIFGEKQHLFIISMNQCEWQDSTIYIKIIIK